jgi:hypothetical protein
VTSATAVLEKACASGVQLSATPDGKLHWRCRGSLPEGLRGLLAEHRVELVALLEMGRPWDQAEADRLVAEVIAARPERFGPSEWPDDPGACRALAQHYDRMDQSWFTRDLDGLETAVHGALAQIARLAHWVAEAPEPSGNHWEDNLFDQKG